MKRFFVLNTLISMVAVSALAQSAGENKLKSLSKKGEGAKVTIAPLQKETVPAGDVDKAAVQRLKTRMASPAQRDSIFKQAGVDATVAPWSEYDKDMLLLRSKEMPMEKLATLYPGFDAGTLGKLQSLSKK